MTETPRTLRLRRALASSALLLMASSLVAAGCDSEDAEEAPGSSSPAEPEAPGGEEGSGVGEGEPLPETQPGPEPEPVASDPGSYQDPAVHLARLPTSAFIEIQEVEALPDGRVLLCTGVKGLIIADATTPSAMVAGATITAPLSSPQYPRCQHVSRNADLVYFSNRGDEIQPTPFVAAAHIGGAVPQTLDSYTEAFETYEGLAAVDDGVYVAMHGDGVARLAWQGDELVRIETLDGLTDATALEVDATYLWVADGPSGLKVIERATGTMIGHASMGGNARSLAHDIARGHMWVGAGAEGLVGVDVSDPTDPTILAKVDTPGMALEVALGQGHIWLSDWNDVRLFDVSDASAPLLITSERVDVSPYPRVLGLDVYEDHAYFGEWTGLHSYRLEPGVHAPDLFIERTELAFPRVDPGASHVEVVEIANHGSEILAITSIETGLAGGPFTVSPSFATLEPGASRELAITFSPATSSIVHGSVTLSSDDPDEPERILPLEGNAPGLGVGDPAPPVTVDLLEGGQWDLADHEGKVVVMAYFATF